MPDPGITATELPAVNTAIAEFRRDDMGHACNDVGGRFNCGEAETLAYLLRALHLDDEANALIDGHAWGDDDTDDLHGICRHCEKPIERVEVEDFRKWVHIASKQAPCTKETPSTFAQRHEKFGDDEEEN